MKKKTQRTAVWTMLILMCIGVVATLVAYFIR